LSQKKTLPTYVRPLPLFVAQLTRNKKDKMNTETELPVPGISANFGVTSRAALWSGRIMSGLSALFLLVDAGMKLAKPPVVVEGTVKFGYSEAVILPLGIVLLVSTILYLLRPTCVLGAILLTGYLGGAVDAHVRASGRTFEILFPVIFGVLLWGGLFLREPSVRALFPLKRDHST